MSTQTGESLRCTPASLPRCQVVKLPSARLIGDRMSWVRIMLEQVWGPPLGCHPPQSAQQQPANCNHK